MATLQQLIEKAGQVAVLKAHPVGSYFITEEDRNPAEILGLGGVSTWVKLEGRVLLGASSAYPVGSEGGEATHTLSGSEMPAHTHDRGTMQITGNFPTFDCGGKEEPYGAFYYAGGGETRREGTTNTGWDYRVGFEASRAWTGSTSSAGSSQPHNNLQPYRSAYIWRRTA